jgi:hypothetical protein
VSPTVGTSHRLHSTLAKRSDGHLNLHPIPSGNFHHEHGRYLDERPHLITQAEREALQRGYDASANAFAGFVVLAPA